MHKVFSKKTVVVTGGASGIGAALVEDLIAYGAVVAVIDRMPDYNGPALYFYADMAVQSEAEQVFKAIISEIGNLDYVINCAGMFMAGEIRDTPLKHWHTVLDNNIFAVSHGSQLAYEHMLGRGVGHIVNVASTAGLIPVPAMGIYGASKYALVGLSHALRNEAKELGIKVSVVCPTIVNTPLYDTALYNAVRKDKALLRRSKLQTPEVAANKILRGIVRNRATIHTSFTTYFIWILYRLAPGVYDVAARKAIAQYRRSLRSVK